MSTAASSSSSEPPSSLVVHHLNNSRSLRILWLLEELQLPYSITKYQRTAAELAPPELLQVHPLGKSPVISDGGRVVAESGCIVDYLIGRYGRESGLLPASEEEALQVSYWSHAAEGSFMPPLLMLKVWTVATERSPFFVRPIVAATRAAVLSAYLLPTIRSAFAFAEQRLQQQQSQHADFMAGQHLTAADFMMLLPLEAAVKRDSAGPCIEAYVQRMHDRPAYKRALEKGGPGAA